ncbi:hypothetical protein V2O64_19335 [Verrucomicrobiaceae bacterium 227]
MELVRYTYFPGWTMGDYTTWDSTIDDSGMVRQHINPEVGKTKRKHGVDLRENRLSDADLADLVETLTSFDTSAFEYLKGLGICIEDVEDIGLQSESFGFNFSGPLLTIQHMAKHKTKAVDPEPLNAVLRIWRHIDRLQPYSLQSQQKKRR